MATIVSDTLSVFANGTDLFTGYRMYVKFSTSKSGTWALDVASTVWSSGQPWLDQQPAEKTEQPHVRAGVPGNKQKIVGVAWC